jgi:hypothetical protein
MKSFPKRTCLPVNWRQSGTVSNSSNSLFPGFTLPPAIQELVKPPEKLYVVRSENKSGRHNNLQINWFLELYHSKYTKQYRRELEPITKYENEKFLITHTL